MEEKTFLLFKPNRYNTRDVYNYVCEELRKKGLIIEKSYQKKLSEEHIKRLWPRQSKDQILLHTFLEMCDEETTIIEICGDNAIDIVYRLKKTVRTIYATGIIEIAYMLLLIKKNMKIRLELFTMSFQMI